MGRTAGVTTMTPLKRRFVELYAGNGVEAMRLAGYKGGGDVLNRAAKRLLKEPLVAEAIRSRETAGVRPYIANRLERQAFWTSVMRGEVPGTDIEDRLAAARDLAKSEGDFIVKVQGTVEHRMPQLKEMSVDELRALATVTRKELTAGEVVDAEIVDADDD